MKRNKMHNAPHTVMPSFCCFFFFLLRGALLGCSLARALLFLFSMIRRLPKDVSLFLCFFAASAAPLL